jgi:hypothetical protein
MRHCLKFTASSPFERALNFCIEMVFCESRLVSLLELNEEIWSWYVQSSHWLLIRYWYLLDVQSAVHTLTSRMYPRTQKYDLLVRVLEGTGLRGSVREEICKKVLPLTRLTKDGTNGNEFQPSSLQWETDTFPMVVNFVLKVLGGGAGES